MIILKKISGDKKSMQVYSAICKELIKAPITMQQKSLLLKFILTASTLSALIFFSGEKWQE